MTDLTDSLLSFFLACARGREPPDQNFLYFYIKKNNRENLSYLS